MLIQLVYLCLHKAIRTQWHDINLPTSIPSRICHLALFSNPWPNEKLL